MGSVFNPISKALGTDGSGGGALGALAKIDPGPSIGKGLAEIDKTVNREIPGGWVTVGGLAAGGTALYFAPEIMAAMAAETGASAAGAGAITTEAGQGAFFNALASGSTSTQAIAAGMTTEQAALAAGGSIASGASQFSPEVIAAANASKDPIGYIASMEGLTPAEMASYGQVAKETGLSAADAFKYYNNAKKLAGILSPGAGMGSSNINANKNKQQIGGSYDMNKNPFAPNQPIETVTDMDKANKMESDQPQFGLANILKNYDKVKDPNYYG